MLKHFKVGFQELLLTYKTTSSIQFLVKSQTLGLVPSNHKMDLQPQSIEGREH